MAQSRLEKIGSIYSRISGLLNTGAIKQEHKPVWFEVYEAFPPKYEPRYDRHLLTYGEGSNVEALGPPRKILYKEDLIRAQFYKVFFPQDGAHSEEAEKVTETFNMMDNNTETLAQKFIKKYLELESKGNISRDQMFRATVDALEIDGVRLLTSSHEVNKNELQVDEDQKYQDKKQFSLKDLFIGESQDNSKS